MAHGPTLGRMGADWSDGLPAGGFAKPAWYPLPIAPLVNALNVPFRQRG